MTQPDPRPDTSSSPSPDTSPPASAPPEARQLPRPPGRRLSAAAGALLATLGLAGAAVHLNARDDAPGATPLSLDPIEEGNRFVHFLKIPEFDFEEEEEPPPEDGDAGGHGRRHKGEEGKMGKPTSKQKSGLYAMKGPKNAIPMMARNFDPGSAGAARSDLLLVEHRRARSGAAPGGEGYERVAENQFIRVDDDPRSTFSIDVDTASYSNTRRFLSYGQLPPPTAVRAEEFINYFDYDYPPPTGDAPFSVISEVGPCPWAEDHKLVHIGLQGETIARDDRAARNLVFLVDVSGSMQRHDKLPLLKQALTLLAADLDAADRVSIVVYAGAAGAVLEPTRGDDTQAILSALNRLEAGGSTNGGAGIELAYKLAQKAFIKGGANRVILASDGDFNVGARGRDALHKLIERKRRSGVFLTVLGFGTGNYQDGTMELLADKGNGNYAYIDTLQEARKVLVDQAGGTLQTIAKDVKIQVEFNPARVADYRLVGYENRALEHKDFDDDTKDAGEIGAGHTVTALYEVVPKTGAVTPSSEGADELMTLKLRYKEPRGRRSKLLRAPVEDAATPLDETSDDFRFSASVAEFAMLLRQSEHRGTATYKQSYELARGAIGEDKGCYRRKQLQLIDKALTAAGHGAVGTPADYQCTGRPKPAKPPAEDARASTRAERTELAAVNDPEQSTLSVALELATGDERWSLTLSTALLRLPLTLYLVQLLIGLPLLLLSLGRRRRR